MLIMMDYLTFSVRCVLQCTLDSVHIVHVCMSSGFLDSTLGRGGINGYQSVHLQQLTIDRICVSDFSYKFKSEEMEA